MTFKEKCEANLIFKTLDEIRKGMELAKQRVLDLIGEFLDQRNSK